MFMLDRNTSMLSQNKMHIEKRELPWFQSISKAFFGIRQTQSMYLSMYFLLMNILHFTPNNFLQRLNQRK